MKNVVLLLALLGCAGLAVACLVLLEKVRRQDEQLRAQQSQIAELEQRVPATAPQKQTELKWLAKEIERRTSQWAPCDTDKMARVVVPVRCDVETGTMHLVVERGSKAGDSVQTHYYEVVLVFAYEGRKWLPQWNRSTAKAENSVKPGPLEETWWLRDLLYDAVADYVLSG